MSKEAAENYLGAIRDSLQSPNMILDLRVPKSAQYQGVVLDTAVAQFLAGEITDDEGRDEQKAAYADSLNIQR
jgi:multiple sugar transport system substrate-binding protein